jgi:hypothetical protein
MNWTLEVVCTGTTCGYAQPDGDDLHNVGFFVSDSDGNSWSVQQISSRHQPG